MHAYLIAAFLAHFTLTAATTINVPLAQSTTQMCTIPPPSSVSVYRCSEELNTVGYTIQCCNSVDQASGYQTSQILGLLDIVVVPNTALVGTTCNPVPAWSLYPYACNYQLLCCQDASFNGIVAVGCFQLTQY
ncbi:hypothetical protein BDQ12DRAFT_735372 [Crucibulum laeve]|uniref:Hydrophobin n=1 Tax=Crucibulum laeve TaxID=68775 RepID=A0A5C3MC53_9AGAR|nr:hypothetical protein BDQ12DRAFT_735372 [Crucibulum laeve]